MAEKETDKDSIEKVTWSSQKLDERSANDRRSGSDRRQVKGGRMITVPDMRSGLDRRTGEDRRKVRLTITGRAIDI